jgi:hypothetical protein
MKKLFIFILLIIISTVEIYAEENNKDLTDLKALFDAGVLNIEEYKKIKKIINNKNYQKNLIKEKQKIADLKEQEKIFKIKCNPEEKKICISSSDFYELGTYKEIYKLPGNLVSDSRKTGKKVHEFFSLKSERHHIKNPGDIIYGMAWFEMFYLGQLKKARKSVDLYGYDLSTYHKKKLQSLIKINKARKKMREALGMSLEDDTEMVINYQWVLGDFLNNDKYDVKKNVIDPDIKKRKILLSKYISSVKKYNERINEIKQFQTK